MEFVKSVPPELRQDADEDQYDLDESQLLASQLVLCEDQYSSTKQIRVTCGAFNVNQKRPGQPQDIRQWLRVDIDPPDLVAVGLQELDMSAGAMLREETEAAKPWRDAFERALSDQWQCVGARQLTGVYLTVFVRKSFLESGAVDGQQAEISVVRCGAIGNTMANKGAVGLRIRCNRTTFAFVTAHLAAHQQAVERRNTDFQRVFELMYFSPQGGIKTPVFLSDIDRVFFFGDLNYRIDLPYDETLALIAKKDWPRLHERDQLRAQLKRPDGPYVRLGFQEMLPEFDPTYKYDGGTNRYDTSEKKRVPAWTDRVLWRARRGTGIERAGFWKGDLMMSDHRPVAGSFIADVKVEIPERKQEVALSIQRRMDQVGGADRFAIPNIRPDKSKIAFGTVQFGSGPSADLSIQNKGHAIVIVHVHSFARDGGPDPSQSSVVMGSDWLSVSPLELLIRPGETETLRVQCCADKDATGPLYERGPFSTGGAVTDCPILTTWLVLSAGQQRFWVECSACVPPSCFGARLEHLAVCGMIPVSQAFNLPRESQPPPPVRPSVPKEVWYLVDYVMRHGVKVPDLFLEDHALPDDFERLRAHLDENSEPIPDGLCDVRCVSYALLRFLVDLHAPVVPPSILQFASKREKSADPGVKPGRAQMQQLARAACQQLPSVNYNVFMYLTAFINFLLRPENQSSNGLTPPVAAQMFGAALFQLTQRGQGSMETVTRAEEATDFVLCFLEGAG
eukprot:Hpha_TRINITY_DN18608_c0_g1::TRINITY_DN18608_c0_g1_i1::g.115694::m.115694/K01099/INPP5B_F; inositol polyphosphate 5-phosphatase INPP5B/F